MFKCATIILTNRTTSKVQTSATEGTHFSLTIYWVKGHSRIWVTGPWITSNHSVKLHSFWAILLLDTQTQTDRQRDRQIETDRQTQRDRHTDRDRQTQRQRDRETDTDKQRDRQTETDRQRETERQTWVYYDITSLAEVTKLGFHTNQLRNCSNDNPTIPET